MAWHLEWTWRCRSISTLLLAALVTLAMSLNGLVLICELERGSQARQQAGQHEEMLGIANVRGCGPNSFPAKLLWVMQSGRKAGEGFLARETSGLGLR